MGMKYIEIKIYSLTSGMLPHPSTLRVSIIVAVVSIVGVLSLAITIILSPTIVAHGESSSSSSSFDYIRSGDATIVNSNDSNKVVILTFGDGWKSQFVNAKPVLDKYGFKASFFVACDRVGEATKMTWQDLTTLHKEGNDVESKTMTGKILTHLPANQLDFEVGQSKQCLADHGINNVTVFATPHGAGSDNATVVNAIAKYHYDFAINGFSNLMFLHCDGYKKESPNQTDCRTFDNNGKLTYANRYVVREWSHNAAVDADYLNNSAKMFQTFVQEVNSQTEYNNNNKGNGIMIDAIPIVAYHEIGKTSPDNTDLGLFAEEMKYLHDNNFRVLTMTDLGFDKNNNYIYVK
jgi:peptidoglycan/xylan/chitin deacetylase (PgdA/CDA1 family)